MAKRKLEPREIGLSGDMEVLLGLTEKTDETTIEVKPIEKKLKSAEAFKSSSTNSSGKFKDLMMYLCAPDTGTQDPLKLIGLIMVLKDFYTKPQEKFIEISQAELVRLTGTGQIRKYLPELERLGIIKILKTTPGRGKGTKIQWLWEWSVD